MPILAEISRCLHLLTTDAKPDPPERGIPGYTNNLPPSPSEILQKSAPTTPNIDNVRQDSQRPTEHQQSTSEFIPDKSETPDSEQCGASNGNRKNSKQTKNRFKTKPYKTAQTANIVNWNIINSNRVQIGATKTYVCNINQITKNTRETYDSEIPKAKTKAMPKAVEDLSTSTREISFNDIFVTKTHIGHGWRDVVRRLGYSDGQLHQFEENHKVKGIDEVIYQALLDWKQANTKDAQIGVLITVMWTCREYDCAERLAATISDEKRT